MLITDPFFLPLSLILWVSCNTVWRRLTASLLLGVLWSFCKNSSVTVFNVWHLKSYGYPLKILVWHMRTKRIIYWMHLTYTDIAVWVIEKRKQGRVSSVEHAVETQTTQHWTVIPLAYHFSHLDLPTRLSFVLSKISQAVHTQCFLLYWPHSTSILFNTYLFNLFYVCMQPIHEDQRMSWRSQFSTSTMAKELDGWS